MVSQQIVDIIIKAQDQASAAAKKVDDSLEKIGKTSSKLSRVPGLDTMKSKLSSVASTIDGKFGGAFSKARTKLSGFKNTISSAASSLRSKFGSAVDGVRSKLSALAGSAKKTESSLGFLRGAASMAAGMIGFELLNNLIEAGRASMNAASQVEYFGQRLAKASGKTKLSAENFSKFKSELSDLQKEFRKVDMTSVGATAEEIALKMNLPANKLGDLTRMTAVLSSTFVKEGRTQEDAVLAVGDALDGQFKRLQEIGITQDKLKENGWNGNLEDQASLIDALNKTMQEMGYEQTAKDITNLDEAMTALTVAGGQLLQKVLVPLTPALISIVEGAIQLADGFDRVIQFFSNNGWAQGALLITGLAVGLGLLSGALVTAEGAFIGLEALMPGFIASLYGAASGFMAITVAGAPLWAIVAAVAAIAIAVYEVGIAFGWWKDVGSMLDAISAGATRLWNAFINHPDVQAAISAISGALSTLWGWIVQAGQAILDFFNINQSGSFDIVRALIDGIGAAWDSVKEAIMTVVGVVQTVIDAFETVIGYLQDFGGQMTGIWATITGIIGPYINQIIGFVMSLINTFNLFRTGQMDLPTFIVTILTQLWNAYVNVTTRIGQLMLNFGSQVLNYAIRAGRNFLNGIVNQIRQVPGRVSSLLLSVVSYISSAIQAWISTAKSKVSTLITNITSPFTGVASTISSALSGVVSAITKPFSDAYTAVKPYIDAIKSGIDTLSNLPWGGDLPTAYGGDIITSDNREVVEVSRDDSLTIDHNVNINLNLDVPGHINTEQLGDILSDRNFIRELVNNRDFQLMDKEAKERLNLKINRSRGI